MKISNNKENLTNYLSLTDKQRLFVDAYIANKFNATKAAVEAGYSHKTARVIGAENLTKPNIKAAIEERTAQITKKHELSIDSVIKVARKVLKKAFNVPVYNQKGELVGSRMDGATCVSILNLLAKFLGMYDGNRSDRAGKNGIGSAEKFGLVLNIGENPDKKPEFKLDLSVLTNEELSSLQTIASKLGTDETNTINGMLNYE